MRVLAVGAHPDDLEILCAGTLAKFIAQGHEVVMANVANGDMGSYVHTRDEIRTVRDAEAKAAAAIIGADHHCVGISDSEVDSTSPEQRALVVDLIREAAPDLIITHSPLDYHTDHIQTSKIVFQTSFLATVPLMVTNKPHHPKVTPIYYMDTVAGIDFQPTEYVDISDHFETKKQMLSQHRSQSEWLGDHDGLDMIGQITAMGQFRGLQSNVAFAEGFQAAHAWPRLITSRLLP